MNTHRPTERDNGTSTQLTQSQFFFLWESDSEIHNHPLLLYEVIERKDALPNVL